MNVNKSYVLLTDSTSDLPIDYVAELGVGIVRLSYTVDGVTREDDSWQSESGDEFYNKMREGHDSTTAQVNVSQYIEFFKQQLEKGLDILYIAFSSNLSGSCNAAMMAAEELKTQFTERKIIIVDSLCASMGEGLLVDAVANLWHKGAGIDEAAAWAEDNKLKVCHIFTVDDLNHLVRGGRISKTTALLGTLMGIKPLMHVDNNGKLVPIGKIRGRRQVIEEMAKLMEKTAVNPAGQVVFISHGNCHEDAKLLADTIKERMGVSKFVINTIGPVIGSHSGYGTLALFYSGTER